MLIVKKKSLQKIFYTTSHDLGMKKILDWSYRSSHGVIHLDQLLLANSSFIACVRIPVQL